MFFQCQTKPLSETVICPIRLPREPRSFPGLFDPLAVSMQVTSQTLAGDQGYHISDLDNMYASAEPVPPPCLQCTCGVMARNG